MGMCYIHVHGTCACTCTCKYMYYKTILDNPSLIRTVCGSKMYTHTTVIPALGGYKQMGQDGI